MLLPLLPLLPALLLLLLELVQPAAAADTAAAAPDWPFAKVRTVGAAMPKWCEAAAALVLCWLLAVLVWTAASAELELELHDWSSSFARVPSPLL
jgi:hypothetical protein